ncbi:hypothetical protein DL766_008114 [Monosporascus sp. MC13-8B]|uniref:Uncharacterized protein n=1 Tax=Monosporascus cannonballus TaxID=155416 RepID=A0ABY0HG02_9PEZI|nr:hypothetical protein DL763_007589 [Monosporascus cannonballus]RYO92631.1 hypothetical protein DL762_001534 [Monosporascus cannonballus]RYP20732.1 hypothetical protein DL766_008114 [Monosporascus sp. MC13-8B]
MLVHLGNIEPQHIIDEMSSNDSKSTENKPAESKPVEDKDALDALEAEAKEFDKASFATLPSITSANRNFRMPKSIAF